MVFISTGSRSDNPYSSRKANSLSGKLYTALSPKAWAAVAAILTLWLLALATLVTENPDIKKEVLDDFHREETILKGKLRQSKLRAKEWLRNKLNDPSVEQQLKLPDEQKHQWDLSTLEDLALRIGPDDTPIHVIFSTDCSPYQHWQAYMFFLSALRVRQPGRVTQIASGCTSDSDKQSIQQWFKEHIAPLSLRFGLHLTPHFSSVKDSSGNTIGDYEFFNKPFGLKHWMEHGKGMGIDPSTKLPWKHDTIVALLDPDQLIVKPITGHFASPGDLFRIGSKEKPKGDNVDSMVSLMEGESQFTVRHGHPASQEYGFRDAWRQYAAKAAGPDSPATKVTPVEAVRAYAVGPPYIATALDTYAISLKWTEFVPKVHSEFPQLLAEMYAYSIATADLVLPHQLMATLMVSDTYHEPTAKGGEGEGWAFIDKIPGDEICSFAMNSLDADIHPLPSVLHLCHRYGVGDRAFFAKKKLPKNFFSCESPLLEEPPMDIGSGKYLYRKPPFVDKKVELSAVVEKREAFMVCASIGFSNEASLYYKNRHCGDDANLKKELSLHDLPE